MRKIQGSIKSRNTKRTSTFPPQQKRRITVQTLTLILIAVSLTTLQLTKNTLHRHLLHHDTANLSQQHQPVASLILPLPLSSAPYTHRKTSHLNLSYQTLHIPNLPDTSFTYLNNKKLAQTEGLYDFSNYVGERFEGSVTHAWVSILHHHSPPKPNDIVVDGGFNTGFYTTLTAAGFNRTVHSFDVQLDCFDVARHILAANGAAANARARLYHFGLSGRNGAVFNVTEGCDPGFSIASGGNKREGPRWDKKTHAVRLTSLDDFLDEWGAAAVVGDVTLLKLDIEGGEISALQKGLVRHRHKVRNIIMEYSLAYTQKMERRSKYEVRERSITLFRELTRDGLSPYLLFHRRVADGGNRSRWTDETYLATVGLKRVWKHPVSSKPVGPEGEAMLWGIDNFDVLLDTVCVIGCNLYFSRGSV